MKTRSQFCLAWMVITLLTVGGKAFSQSQPYAWQLTDEDGLPGNEVYTMLQDSNGYVWLGTNGGLARYDGTVFKTYSHPEQRSRSFSNLRLDNRGRVWCNNFGGQIFYVQNDSLVLFREWEKYQKGNFPQFEIIGEKLYVSSLNNAVKMYDFQGKKWSTITTGEANSWTIGCGKTSSGQFSFWEIRKGAFVLKNGKPESVTTMGKCGNQYGYFSQSVGKQLFLFDQCGHIREWQKDKFETSPLQGFAAKLKTYILNIHRDTDGDYWLLTQGGARCYSTDGILRLHFLPDIPTYSVMNDREGNTWVSTMGHGVYIIPNKKIRMPDLKLGAKEYSVSHLCPVRDSLMYMATRQGKLVVYNSKNFAFIREIKLPDVHEVQSMYYEEETGRLYVNIIHTHVLDTRTFRWLDIKLFGATFKEMAGANQQLFAAGSAGLAVHRTYSSPLASFFPSHQFNYSQKELPFANLSTGRANCVWTNWWGSEVLCGFNDGLFLFKDGKKTEIRWERKPLIATRIRAIKREGQYISTIGRGLLGYKDGIIFQVKHTAKDLLNMETDGDNLYLITENGIQIFNASSWKISTINKGDGLASSAISDVKIVGGNLWIAGSRGVQVIPVTHDFINHTAPKVFISRVSVNDRDTPILQKAILPHNLNDIRIFFSGIGIRSRGALQFRYRLLGLDTGWSIAENNSGMARFSSLRPGSYTFEVYAVNEDGIASQSAARFQFEIQKPYWQTWWFLLVLIGLMAGLIYMVYAWRLRSAKQKATIDRNLLESEMKALKSQMNPHFIFNALNSIKEYILTNKPKEAGRYLTKFANLMRAYLDQSEQKAISLQTEIESLQLYLELEALRFQENFSYEINVDSTLDKDSISLPPMLIQPYVENAIKHGLLHQSGTKHLSISFTLTEEHILCCTIEDNGIGREASAKLKAGQGSHHQSFATGATQKRLELLNQQRQNPLTVSYTDLPQGTKVQVWVPV